MIASSLSNGIKRTFNSLRQNATKQVTNYEQRFSTITNIYDDLLSDFIREGIDPKQAYETAREFFDCTTVRFAGVDGTMYSKPLFDMVIFFGGAYAATGTLQFSETAKPEINYDERTLQRNLGISSVVPIYINEIPEVDTSYAAQDQPGEVNPAKPMTDEEIANNSLIANAIMTFSEYYLAYKIAADPNQKTHVILMDRSLSSERASLLYETRKTGFWKAKTALVGYKSSGDEIPLDNNDIIIARQHVSNTALGLPPPRSDYLRTAIICLLERSKALTASQIAVALGATEEKRSHRIERALERLCEREILTVENATYMLNPRYMTSWKRIKQVTNEVGDRMFFTKNPSMKTSSSMKILKGDKEHWLTTVDIAFLTLFALQMLMEECWKKHLLLVGVTKDTAARDFKRQLVPIMNGEGLLKTSLDLGTLQALPNTDRMILQSASVLNVDRIAPPWSLIEYDSSFRTILPDSQNRHGYVSGAIRNKISLEKAFVKTYVQLSQARSDPRLRSNVLLVDRLAYSEYDYKPENMKIFWNELSDGTREPVETVLYADKSVPNRIQNMMISVLVAMAPLNIPEAFGHNKALFIADKIAKWNYNQFKCVVDSTATWILNNHKLRKFVFYMSTFRERRESIEQTRRKSH